jgi:sugar/nucleoside kinase (ribokinase family)
VSLTVVGSIAFDTVSTPFGERERMLGGSAVHFALAASFFTEVNVVGPVGDDFGDEHLEILAKRRIDTSDIERVPGGQTFFWRGHYDHDMNVAHTDDTQLNVFADFEPKLSPASCEAQMLFLGNIQPDLQRRVRKQSSASFAGLDSMNLWIDTARESLVAAISEVDCLLLNDAELRMLTSEANLVQAARATMAMGPSVIVAKRGEYGAVLFTDEGSFAIPGLPLEDVRDPTGAGDSFAGGFLGYLDSVDEDQLSEQELRRAMTYGSTMASFNVEQFGTERVQALTHDEINRRFEEFRLMTHLDAEPVELRFIG